MEERRLVAVRQKSGQSLIKKSGSKMIVLPPNLLKSSSETLKEKALFVKWNGQEGSREEIISCWRESFLGKLSIGPLQNMFFLIECNDSIFKMDLLYGIPIFFKGSSFYRLNWSLWFDPLKHIIVGKQIWISLVGFP